MRLLQLSTVVAIAETGSVRSAARLLKKSQPALTKSLHQLEEELGCTIFQRSQKGVVLTKMGETILARAKTIVSEIDRIQQDASQLHEEMAGNIHVSASPIGGILLLPEAIHELQRRFPLINVVIENTMYPAALTPLREGVFDLVIGPEPPNSAGTEFTVERLLSTDLMIIASRDHKLSQAKTLEELVDCKWIIHGGPGSPSTLYTVAFEEAGLEAPKAKIYSTSLYYLIAMVENSDGIAVLPGRLRDYILQRNNLSVIPASSEFPVLNISSFTRANVPLTPAAEELMRWIRLISNRYSD